MQMAHLQVCNFGKEESRVSGVNIGIAVVVFRFKCKYGFKYIQENVKVYHVDYKKSLGR